MIETIIGRLSIGCGMYAFTPHLQQAWRQFFSELSNLSREQGNADSDPFHTLEPMFSTDDQMYESTQTILGHTCGYPYMKKWRHSHRPVCVPVFDIKGCDGIYYRSWFICRQDDPRTRLENFAGSTAAINSLESNSGMNVLRFAISEAGARNPFFGAIKITGSHQNSMRLIYNSNADFAAVDPVSYYFACQHEPWITDHLRLLGQSEPTAGLPFVQRRDTEIDPDTIIKMLNRTVRKMAGSHSNPLQIQGFKKVEENDYSRIMEIEQLAIAAGYPTLE